VEAGLRSFDKSMPEEVNRVVTDRLSDLLLTPSRDANANLLHEGVHPARMVLVGNVMIDSVHACKARAEELDTLKKIGVTRGNYAVCTLHRPANVDDPQTLGGMMGALGEISRRIPVIFPVHPRTQAELHGQGLSDWLAGFPDLRMIDPLGYLEFLCLTSQARLILTDSGGLQEESTALGIPCLTLRESTERPVTVAVGTNKIVGTEPAKILAETFAVLDGNAKQGSIPELWDGRAGERVAYVYERFLETREAPQHFDDLEAAIEIDEEPPQQQAVGA
jgi:UDP-N-acetylglucosamine 2-epimerase (non-hydrolysing)